MYYTYAYLREDKTPYYIGKGKNNRAYKKGNRVVLPPPKDRILILKQNLTEEEAFKHEKYMIAIFGRKDLGTGILRNLTDGGEGSSNWGTPEQRSERSRKIWSNLTPEQLSKRSRKISESRTSEQRSEAAKKANITPERRSEAAKKKWANMTPERRSEILKKISGKLSSEQRSQMAKERDSMRIAREAYINRTTPEQRSADARQRQLNKSPEQMKKERKQAVETYFSRTTPEQRAERGRKTQSQRWQCTETGYVTSPGGLSRYQKKRGIDTSKRIRLS